tara:strand:- start:278 stop:595 length:318 start_codon:yes stop_codon:yes gene_type:complete
MLKDQIIIFHRDTDEGIAVKASSFLGMEPQNASHLHLFFKSTADNAADEKIKIEFPGTMIDAMQELAGVISSGTSVATQNKTYVFDFTGGYDSTLPGYKVKSSAE